MTIPTHSFNTFDSDSNAEIMITDFTPNSADLGWHVVNDNVMGGRSEGGFKIENEQLSFTGSTNTTGGGFSSIRTKDLQQNLSNHAGIQLYLKGDGRRYTWRLTSTARSRGEPVSYWANFDTQSGLWITVNIPFSDFVPRFRGTVLKGPVLDTSQITGMGVMIYDKKDGPFALQLAHVHAYSTNTPFTLAQHRWKNRVLVISAPNEDDANLKTQLNALALSLDEFVERDLTLIILLDKGISTVANRTLTASEAATARAAAKINNQSFALRLIGKDGSVKLSGHTATSMAEIYALIDSMPMRQGEKKHSTK